MTDQPNHNRSGDNASDRPRPTHEAAHEREPRSSRFSHRPEEQRDHSPYGRRKAPGFENENVHYLNVEALTRPLEIPTKVKRGMIVALAIATIVGAMMLFAYFDGVVNAPAREKEQMQQMLSEEIALELPDLASLAQLDDATIMSALQSAGGTYYEKTPIGTLPHGGFDVIKLPEDVTLADAGAMYLAGLDKLSAYDAARLLNGSWDLEVNRDDATSLRVRYADFHAESVEVAVQRAIDAAGLSDATIDDSGVDESGNTFAAGTVNREGANFAWRISALELDEVYKIKDLPNNTFYVGVRFTIA